MVPALHSEESMGQLRSKSGTGKHFMYIPGNGAKRQLISVRVDVHYQGTGVYRSPRAGFLFTLRNVTFTLGILRIPDFKMFFFFLLFFFTKILTRMKKFAKNSKTGVRSCTLLAREARRIF